MKIKNFLKQALNLAIAGKEYREKITIEDGGNHSHIALVIEIDTFLKGKPITAIIRLYRHTNTLSLKEQEFEFQLGSYTYPIEEYTEQLLSFKSYTKTREEAALEAEQYFRELQEKIKIKTKEIREEEEKEVWQEFEELKNKFQIPSNPVLEPNIKKSKKKKK